MRTPEISVVVPTRDRPGPLAGCLSALEGQNARSLEVVVVDDGSADGSAVAGVVSAFPRARLVRQPPHGPAAARNRGVREAHGELICFTDDDCAPIPGWAGALSERVAAYGEIDSAPPVAGATVDAGGTGVSAASQAITNALLAASRDERSGRVGFAPTSNLACARALARELPFDESFVEAGGEDRDWCRRAGEREATPIYEPRAIVYHNQRLDLRRFVSQQLRYGRGSARCRRLHGGSPETVRFAAELSRAALMGGSRVTALFVFAQLLDRAGAASERARRREREMGRRRA